MTAKFFRISITVEALTSESDWHAPEGRGRMDITLPVGVLDALDVAKAFKGIVNDAKSNLEAELAAREKREREEAEKAALEKLQEENLVLEPKG